MTSSYNNTSTIKTVKAAYGLWKETINGEVGYQSENFGAGFRWFVRPNPRFKQGTKTPQLELCVISTDRVASTTTVEGPVIDFTPTQPEQPVSEPITNAQEVTKPEVSEPITDAQEVTKPEVTEPAPEAKKETPKPTKRSPKKAEEVLVPDTEEIPF